LEFLRFIETKLLILISQNYTLQVKSDALAVHFK